MGKNCFLAVDLGATSGRTVLATFDGTKVQMDEFTRFKNPIIHVGGHYFWDLPHLYNEIIIALKKAAQENVEITSIGIDTWGVDVAFFGKDGQLLGLPYCYRDTHTNDAMPKFFEKMPSKEVYQRTGIQFMQFNTLFQLDTLKRNGCSALEAADKILFIPDALSYMLTGKAVTEYTIASTSQFLDPNTGELDEKLLETAGVSRSQFGPMVQPGAVIGTLTEQVQAVTGMGPVKVVAVGGHDTASAVASVPATSEEFAYLSCGTWSLLGIESKKPIITEQSFAENFTNEGGLDGTTRFLKNICGLWLFEQSRKDWKNVPESIKELTALCDTTDFSSVIYPDAPEFASPDCMVDAICAFCRKTGQPEPQTPAEYIRCIYRSLALRYRQVIGILNSMCGFTIKSLNVIGGGSQNPHLMQLAANATGIPVICGPTEGTALGNVLVQLRTAGQVKDLAEMRKISAASVSLKTYLPDESRKAVVEESYKKFLEFAK